MPGNTLRKGARIAKSADFRRAMRNGHRYRGCMVSVSVVKGGPGGTRLGIIVPARLVKLATGRNRIKRLIREIFRTARQHFREENADIVIKWINGPDADQKGLYDKLREEIEKLLKAAKIIG